MLRKHGALKIRAFDYEVKETDASGKFAGYGSVFGNVDSYNETVAPGAFLESIAQLKAQGRTLPVLWQHRGADPIGNWDIHSLREDGHGLYGAGQLWLDEAPYARIAFKGMDTKSITGLSIGYYVRDSAKDQKTGVVTLKKIDLVEISIVTNPANDAARVDTIKAKLAHGSAPTLREFEELLREQGFSKQAAAIIATRGYMALLDRGEPGGDTAGEAIAATLRGFKLPL